jgi:hypothetical protein
MKIGVVCEGPTDLPAVVAFFGDYLERAGINPVFKQLFPDPDRTKSQGGWGNLFSWLKNNPPQTRVSRYFGQGLFANFEDYQRIDAILFQVDADVLDDEGFHTFVKREFGIDLPFTDEPVERGALIRRIIEHAADLELLTLADKSRHVFAVAVESTETWCIAAFHQRPDQFETFRSAQLRDEFMKALERSEGRVPLDAYAQCDKSSDRRAKYCKHFRRFSGRVVASCPHFAEAAAALRAIAT